MQLFNLDEHLPMETPHLTLRKLTAADAGDIFSYASDPAIARFVPWEHHSSREDTLVFIEDALRKYEGEGGFDLAIVHREEGRVIGALGFARWDRMNHWAELGYAISRAWWGRGVADEAARALIEIGFGPMGLHRIEAMCMHENVRSEKVMLKLGMTLEGVKHGRMYANGEYHDGKMYYMINP